MKALKALTQKFFAPVVIALLATLWMVIIVDTQDSTGLMCWLFALAAGLSVNPTPAQVVPVRNLR